MSTTKGSRVRYASELLERRGADELSMHLGLWPDEPDRDLASAQRRLDELVIARANLCDGLVVLDVGCGLGGTLARIDRQHHALELIGVNVDRSQLDVARASLRPSEGNSIRWVEASADDMPLGDASIHRLISVEAAFHFPSRGAFVVEAARVLAPGGRMVITDIVATDRMRALRDAQPALAFALEQVLDRGIGPFGDLWGEAPGWPALIASSQLRLGGVEDLSQATLPSYRCFLSDDQRATPGAMTNASDMDRAVALLEWLHASGHVKVVMVWADAQDQ